MKNSVLEKRLKKLHNESTWEEFESNLKKMFHDVSIMSDEILIKKCSKEFRVRLDPNESYASRVSDVSRELHE